MKKTIKETRNMINKVNEVLGEAPIDISFLKATSLLDKTFKFLESKVK